MSIAPFAAIELRLNRAVQARLANASAVYQGGEAFGVLFDRTAQAPFGEALDAAQPSAAFCIANTPGLTQGSELAIDGVVHIVAGQVQPDAGGWVVVDVYPKA